MSTGEGGVTTSQGHIGGVERPRARTIGDLVAEQARVRPDGEALVCGDQRFSWSELDRRVRAVAAGLVDLGVGHGERVAMVGANSAEWIITDLACASIGAVFMGLSTWYKPQDFAYVLKHSEARTIVVAQTLFGKELAPVLRAVAEQVDSVREVVVIGEPAKGEVAWRDLAATSVRDLSERRPSASDLAAILYTSGSTAAPKGVMLHHGDLIDNGWEIGERQHLTPEDRLWLGIPLFFSFGSANALMAALTHGVALVVQERFDPTEAVRLIDREQCSVYYGMAHMTRALLDARERLGTSLPSLRTGLTIGPPEVIRMTAELVPQIANVYGLTETYGNCAVTDAHASLEERSTTQGGLLPGFEVRIVEPETGEEVEPGTVGSILVRGRVTSGYFRDESATRAAFTDEGWFNTGDLGHLTDGRIVYAGRLKEMLKVGGINVSPQSVEDVLLGYQGVRHAHVVGRPDASRGELPVAVIVWDGEADVEGLRAHCRERLASYAVPVDFFATTEDELPRTGTGKVRRSDLTALFEGGTA